MTLGKGFQLLCFLLSAISILDFLMVCPSFKLHWTVFPHFESECIASAKFVLYINMTIHLDLARIVLLYACYSSVIINSITFPFQRCPSLNNKLAITQSA